MNEGPATAPFFMAVSVSGLQAIRKGRDSPSAYGWTDDADANAVCRRPGFAVDFGGGAELRLVAHRPRGELRRLRRLEPEHLPWPRHWSHRRPGRRRAVGRLRVAIRQDD